MKHNSKNGSSQLAEKSNKKIKYLVLIILEEGIEVINDKQKHLNLQKMQTQSHQYC